MSPLGNRKDLLGCSAGLPCALVSKALRLNHHRRGANDGDGASIRTGTDYRSNNIDDSNADNSPRNIPDKGRNKRVRQIYQSNRQPSLFEARKPRAQALTKLGEPHGLRRPRKVAVYSF